MADEQEIEVKLDDGTPPAPAPETVDIKEQPAAESKPEPKVEDALSELSAQLRAQYEDRAAKDDARVAQAERQAQEAREQASRASDRAVSSELQATTTAIAAAQSTVESAKRDYQAALEAADYSRASDAQERLAGAAAEKAALERDKRALESQPATPAERTTTQQQAPIQVTDVFEAAIAQFNPRTKGWLRVHRDVVTDPETGAKATWAHHAAVKQNIAPDSDEYYQFIERQLYGDPQPQTQTATTRPRPMTAAPPSRDNASAPGASTKIKLSAGEVASATDGTIVFNTGPNKGKPIGTQEMAKRKARGLRDGLYNRVAS